MEWQHNDSRDEWLRLTTRRSGWRALGLAAVVAAAAAAFGCNGDSDEERDPHVVENPGDLPRNREFVSPPTLGQPIYACAPNATVTSFRKDALLEIWVAGESSAVGSAIGEFPSLGANVPVSPNFSEGQVVTATQTVDGVTSAPSNAVVVSSHTVDYPDGLPEPRLWKDPIYECGRAILAEDVVPGSTVTILHAEDDGAGGFDPAVEVGSFNASTEWGLNWTGVSPAFVERARVHATARLCTAGSESQPLIVQPEPPAIPPGKLEEPVIENAEIVTAWGQGGEGDPLVHGAVVRVLESGTDVGGTATPGGTSHLIGIDPKAGSSSSYTVSQALCTDSGPGPAVVSLPCSELPPAKIEPASPGDTQIVVTDFQPGAQILVFASGQEIGDSGPPVINLSRPLVDGETVTVLQILGDCESRFVYVINVDCSNKGGDALACSGDWPAFQHDGLRTAHQAQASAVSDPSRVKTLKVRWHYRPPDARGFRASPMVWDGRVYVGNGNGYLYALDAATGALLWSYPDQAAGDDPLDTQYHSNSSSFGIASSAAIGITRERGEVVIFGAPDPSIGANLGSGRLFALDPVSGAEVWKSPEIAVLDGTQKTSGGVCSPAHANYDAAACAQGHAELHEQIGYSSPLVFRDRVYIGIANHGDNPIQNGRIAAVDVNGLTPVSGFDFKATGTRGGGVWSSVGGGLEGDGIYATTGNTRAWNGGSQSEPSPNHGLSLLRLDRNTGGLTWKLQPVPFSMDLDPDWASGPTLMSTSCGPMVASTMKDGWSYGVAADGTVGWQFPPTCSTPGSSCFNSGNHGDSRYLVPAAGWNDVFITMTGGVDVESNVSAGFHRLHALNVCGSDGGRIRWIVNVTSGSGAAYRLGPPSVTHGVVYVGTHDGRIVSIADPSIYYTAQSICSNADVPNTDCVANGYHLVPRPIVLRNLDLSDAASWHDSPGSIPGAGAILTEPAIAGGRVFVSTTGGVVYMLEPEP